MLELQELEGLWRIYSTLHDPTPSNDMDAYVETFGENIDEVTKEQHWKLFTPLNLKRGGQNCDSTENGQGCHMMRSHAVYA